MKLKEATFTELDIVKMCEKETKAMKERLGLIKTNLMNSESFKDVGFDARKMELMMNDLALRLKLLEEYIIEKK